MPTQRIWLTINHTKTGRVKVEIYDSDMTLWRLRECRPLNDEARRRFVKDQVVAYLDEFVEVPTLF